MAAVPASRPEVEDFFTVLGVTRRFGLDLAAIERRYYELSRELHPDRFAARSPLERADALERMSRVNQAYSTLKDPVARRDYLLQLEGFELPKGTAQGTSGIPMDLAEQWFELQEQVLEDPSGAQGRIESFRTDLESRLGENARAIAGLEAEFDRTQERSRLEEILRLIQLQNYLASLARNTDRWVSR